MAKARNVNVALTGVRELDKAMKQLDVAFQKKIVRFAVREAAKPVLEEAKRLVPVRTGALKRSLRIRALKRSRRRSTIGVQVVTGKDFFKGDTYYGGFIEFGTKRMAARPFLRPAADRMKNKAAITFRQSIRPGALREIKKLEAKARKRSGFF